MQHAVAQRAHARAADVIEGEAQLGQPRVAARGQRGRECVGAAVADAAAGEVGGGEREAACLGFGLGLGSA